MVLTVAPGFGTSPAMLVAVHVAPFQCSSVLPDAAHTLLADCALPSVKPLATRVQLFPLKCHTPRCPPPLAEVPKTQMLLAEGRTRCLSPRRMRAGPSRYASR